jgi:penicillin-binding protein 2
MSAQNAQKLSRYLQGVITDGTGKAAKPNNTTAAGKTATAQTGRYKNGVEITHSWFCGFFPAETPKYAVCVMVEEGGGSAEFFSKIADHIAEITPIGN